MVARPLKPLALTALLVALALLASVTLPAVEAAPGGQGGKGPMNRFTFSWRTQSSAFPPQGGYLDEGGSASVPFTLDRMNLTAVAVVLTWQDSLGHPDNMTLGATTAGGTPHGPAGGSGGDGRIEIPVVLGNVPQGEVIVDASTEAEAWRAFLRAHPPVDVERGQWSAQVTLTDAGDLDVAGVVTPDTGNNYTLAVSYVVYTGVLVKKEKLADEPAQGTCPGAPGCPPVTPNGTEPDPSANDTDGTDTGTGAPRAPRGSSARVEDPPLLTPMRMVAGGGAAVIGIGVALLVTRRREP